MKRRMRWLFDYLVNFFFIYFLLHVEESSFCYQFFSFNYNLDFFISDEKQSNKMGYYLQKIYDVGGWWWWTNDYEWSNLIVIYFCEIIFRCCISVTFCLDLFSWMEKLTITFVKSNIKTPFLAFFVVLLLQIDIITVFREYIFANWTTIHKTRKKINAKFIFNKYF